jgi:hypothetical protein
VLQQGELLLLEELRAAGRNKSQWIMKMRMQVVYLSMSLFESGLASNNTIICAMDNSFFRQCGNLEAACRIMEGPPGIMDTTLEIMEATPGILRANHGIIEMTPGMMGATTKNQRTVQKSMKVEQHTLQKTLPRLHTLLLHSRPKTQIV